MSWSTCMDKGRGRKRQHGRASRGGVAHGAQRGRSAHADADGVGLSAAFLVRAAGYSGCQRWRQPWAGAVSWSRRAGWIRSPGRQRQGVRWPCGRSTFIPSVPQVYHIVRKAAGSANIRPARAICHSLVALAPQRTVLRARRSFPRPIIAIRWRLAAVAKWSSYPPNVSCYCIFFLNLRC